MLARAIGCLLLTATPACGKSAPTDTCAHVGQRVKSIVEDAEYSSSLSARQMAEKLGSLHQDLAFRCNQESWPAETRACFLKARAMADLLRCDPQRPSASVAAPGQDASQE